MGALLSVSGKPLAGLVTCSIAPGGCCELVDVGHRTCRRYRIDAGRQFCSAVSRLAGVLRLLSLLDSAWLQQCLIMAAAEQHSVAGS